MRICAIAHMYLWGFVLGAHTAELDALLEELYEMTGSGGDEEPEASGETPAKKPSVSDVEFLKFLEEMKADSGANEVAPIVATPASIQALDQELSQDVEEIIRQAEESNPNRRKNSLPPPPPPKVVEPKSPKVGKGR